MSALARFGHALSDETRAQILMDLSRGPSYPADLAQRLEVSRQSMSNHLACLRGCGLVVAIAEGRRTRYELASEQLGRSLADLRDLVLATDPAACAASESEDCC